MREERNRYQDSEPGSLLFLSLSCRITEYRMWPPCRQKLTAITSMSSLQGRDGLLRWSLGWVIGVCWPCMKPELFLLPEGALVMTSWRDWSWLPHPWVAICPPTLFRIQDPLGPDLILPPHSPGWVLLVHIKDLSSLSFVK